MSFLFEISIILLLATLLGFFARILKQPLIIAYIITGILASPVFFNLIKSQETLWLFSDFGVAFLLFIVGLNMNFKTLKEVGFISFITGVGQVIFTSIIGYLICILMGFTPIQALYISVALTFSSTIIVVKLLTDKNELETLYGRISVGFLLVQDFIAIGILMILGSIATNVVSTEFALDAFIKGSSLFVLVFFFNRFVFPRAFEKIARSQELLFISGIAWCLLLSYFSYYLGFSIEIGAFLAGISLASIPYHYELAGRIRPLRDFFVVIFFVMLGSQMSLFSVNEFWVQATILSLFVLLGNPLIVMILMGLFGYKKKTGFMAGLTVAQISEFSLVLIAMGIKLGHLPQPILPFVTLIGLITISISSYMIIYNDKLYHKIGKYFPEIKRGELREHKTSYLEERKNYDAIIIGCHRMGGNILRGLKRRGMKIYVVDFNPDVIKRLTKENVPCLYGDVSDPEIIDKIKEYWPKIVISTLPNLEDNIVLIEKMKEHDKNVVIIATSNSLEDTLKMYEAGADYVILPHFLGGEKAKNILKSFIKMGGKKIENLRKNHIEEIKKQMENFK